MKKTNCSICGEDCNNYYTISDKLFVNKTNSPVCSTCFQHFCAGDDEWLLKKLNNRITE